MLSRCVFPEAAADKSDLLPLNHLRVSQVVLGVKNPAGNAGDIRDVGSIPGSGRSPGEGHENLFLYSCLENPLNRRTWWATVHSITKSKTQLKWLSKHAHLSVKYKCAPLVHHQHPLSASVQRLIMSIRCPNSLTGVLIASAKWCAGATCQVGNRQERTFGPSPHP